MTGSESPRKIMIVDDMRTVRMLLPAYFVGKNYVFFEAESGREALDNLASFQPDLIITDVHMPEMDGFELCRAARQVPHYSELPVVLITGDPDIEALTAKKALGCKDAIVTKPLDPEEVRDLVEKLLDGRPARLAASGAG